MSRTFRKPVFMEFHTKAEINENPEFYKRRATIPRFGFGRGSVCFYESHNYGGGAKGYAVEGQITGWSDDYNKKDKHIAKRKARHQLRQITIQLVDQHYIDLVDDMNDEMTEGTFEWYVETYRDEDPYQKFYDDYVYDRDVEPYF